LAHTLDSPMDEAEHLMAADSGMLILAAFVLVAMVGGVVGIALERRSSPAQPALQNAAVRDALLPVAGWASLAALYGFLVLFGEYELPAAIKHLLATFALVLYFYAALATLRLIYRSGRRIVARILAPKEPPVFRPLPVLGRLAFPTMFVSALLSTIAVFWHDGVSPNFVFVAVLLALIFVTRKPRE
jgi:hypothetical protein